MLYKWAKCNNPKPANGCKDWRKSPFTIFFFVSITSAKSQSTTIDSNNYIILDCKLLEIIYCKILLFIYDNLHNINPHKIFIQVLLLITCMFIRIFYSFLYAINFKSTQCKYVYLSHIYYLLDVSQLYLTVCLSVTRCKRSTCGKQCHPEVTLIEMTIVSTIY